MSEDTVNILKRSLIDAQQKGDVESIEKILSAMKDAAEINKIDKESRKIDHDLEISTVQKRASIIQALSSVAVPIVSMLTIIATLYFQAKTLEIQQTDAENKRITEKISEEDTKWAKFIENIKSDTDSEAGQISLIPPIRDFLRSKRYKDATIDVIKIKLPSVTNLSLFSSLFDIVFTNVSAANIKDIAEISSKIRQRYKSSMDECLSIKDSTSMPAQPKAMGSGFCSNSFSEEEIANLSWEAGVHDKLRTYRRLISSNLFIQDYISNRIRNFLVGLPIEGRDALANLTLAGMQLSSINLSNVDFTGFDISNTLFHNVILRNAVIVPKSGMPTFSLSAWWDAKKIDQNILIESVLKREYPYRYLYEKYTEYDVVEFEDYAMKVNQLCVPGQAICRKECLLFKGNEEIKPSCNSSIRR